MNQKNGIQGTTPGKTMNNEGLVDQAKHVVENVVGNVTGQAREQVTTQVAAQKDKAVDTIGGVADALRKTSSGMTDAGPLPMIADQAADTVERVASYLQSRTLGDLVGEVERFARREPAIFLGSAFAIGLLGGRFLKSSVPNRDTDPSVDRFEYDRDDREPVFTPRRMAPALPPLAPRTTNTASTSTASTGAKTGSSIGTTTTPMKAIQPPGILIPGTGNGS